MGERVYRAREFATLAGITIKALRYYERLGLLKPRRSAAGYRLYGERDLEKLQQILALKFLGLPLNEVRRALERTPEEFSEALRMQRRALSERQGQIERAIRAIDAVEKIPCSTPALQKLIEVMRVHDAIEEMKRYYATDAEWERRERYYEEGPGPEWRDLYRDAAALLNADPADGRVQALADRWLALTVRAAQGDPEVQQDSHRAWADREHWPAAMKARVQEFQLEEVTELITRAALCARKKYFSEEAWNKVVEERRRSGMCPSTWQARVDLFRAVEKAIDGGTADREGKAFADEWRRIVEVESGGDEDVRTGLWRCWRDRRNWSAVVRWREEGLCGMNGERFEQVAAQIESASRDPG